MKTFEITKQQILQLNSYDNYSIGVALKQWFPDAFQSELEVRIEDNGLDSKNCNGWIFKDGKWAEIISEPLTLEQRIERIEEQLKIKK